MSKTRINQAFGHGLYHLITVICGMAYSICENLPEIGQGSAPDQTAAWLSWLRPGRNAGRNWP